MPPGPRRIAGRAVLATIDGERPLQSQWVVLHRVGADTAGAIDSVRTRANGGFAFDFRPFGASGAVYFLSLAHAGIAHFSLPWTAEEGGEDADIVAFDTTSASVNVEVHGRHLIVFAPDTDGRRRVVEVHDLANESILTRVAGDTGSVWSGILPDGATGFAPGPGDFSADALELRDGRVLLLAPMSPGTRQFSYAYTVESNHTLITLPVLSDIHSLEVLVEERDASVAGAGLAETSPVAIEGRMFRRFLAEDVAANSVFTVEVTPPPALSRGLFVAIVLLAIGVAMLIALAVAFRRRSARTGAPVHFTPRMVDAAEPLAREIADLDAEFAARAEPTASERAEYDARRRELKALLADILARQGRA
jgi:hypothetical protein